MGRSPLGPESYGKEVNGGGHEFEGYWGGLGVDTTDR